MAEHEDYRRLYDDAVRGESETPSASDVVTLGPLRLVRFVGGRGFVTYRDLGGAGERDVHTLVGDALAHFTSDASVQRVEWKTRGHDAAPGLHDALGAHGFEPGERETVLMGEAATLALQPDLPSDVVLRRVDEDDEDDVRRVSAAADRAFGDDVSRAGADALLRRFAVDRPHQPWGMSLWAAQAGDEVVASGRLEPLLGTSVAGIWGGATLPAWRGRGVYRALVAARAEEALRIGATVLHSDSTDASRPILERAGLVAVTTTTPYTWRRD